MGTLFILGHQACTATASAIQSSRLQFSTCNLTSTVINQSTNVSFSDKITIMLTFLFQGYIVL